MLLNYISGGQPARLTDSALLQSNDVSGFLTCGNIIMMQLSSATGGKSGRVLFTLVFASALTSGKTAAAAAVNGRSGTDAEETMFVSAAPGSDPATDGYQPLSTSTATLTAMPMLDIPQVVNTVSDKVLEDQHVTTLDEALYNVANVVQTNTLGHPDAFTRRGFGANRDGSIMTNGLRTVVPRSFNAATSVVEVLKGPASTLYGILDPGGLINVITKRPQTTFAGAVSGTSSSFGGGGGQLDVTGPIDGTRLAYRLIGDYQHRDYWRRFGKTAPALSHRR